MPGKKITGSVQFINPEIVPGTRINLLRVNVPGSGGLKPGMPAYVTLTRREEKSLTLPMDAVLRDGKMSVVWVKTGENSFKMRMVETGIETGDRIAIRSGLKEGDIVVTNGAYLINSEYIFKKGTNTMGGMDMSTHQH
jgi:Cu(I)/Ag(I) efflux system membrane fusion protein